MGSFERKYGMSPQEFHKRFAWRGRRCQACGGPPAVRIKVLSPVSEISPEVLAAIAASNPDRPGSLPVVPLTFGNYLKVSDIFACANCRTTAEREAAKLPSWCVVEFEQGPDPKDRVTVGVPR